PGRGPRSLRSTRNEPEGTENSMKTRTAGIELRWERLRIGLEDPLGAAQKARAKKAWEGLQKIRETGRARGLDEPCLWPRLPFIEPGHPNSPDAIDALHV